MSTKELGHIFVKKSRAASFIGDEVVAIHTSSKLWCKNVSWTEFSLDRRIHGKWQLTNQWNVLGSLLLLMLRDTGVYFDSTLSLPVQHTQKTGHYIDDGPIWLSPCFFFSRWQRLPLYIYLHLLFFSLLVARLVSLYRNNSWSCHLVAVATTPDFLPYNKSVLLYKQQAEVRYV